MKINEVSASRIVEFSNNGISDSLTGAPAPKLFLDNLAREISKAKRKIQTISIITVKLLANSNKSATRGIKSNIKFEKDLVAVSNLIKSNMRSGDFYSRIAENGFWICLQGDLSEAAKACERLGLKIAEHRLRRIDIEKIEFSKYEWKSSLDLNSTIQLIDVEYFS